MKAVQRITCFDAGTGDITIREAGLQFIREAECGKLKEAGIVGLYPSFVYQTVEGYGCAMTESACYLLSRMDPAVRKEALECWFGPKGIGARFMRIPIDSCDYSLEEYQAVADPAADPDLETFSIERDKKYIIPMVKEAIGMSAEPISVLLSPWSPPAVWKTAPEITENDAAVYGGMGVQVDVSKPGRCFGGRLKPEYYASWAKYLVKYIQAYLAEEIPVTMLSVQNESNAATSWDSCVWSGKEEKAFLKNYLYPELKKAGLDERIGIYIWDHNKERMVENIEEMMDEDTIGMIEGFAYHWYTGDHFDALSMLHGKYPGMVLMHSESCGLHIPGKTAAFEQAGAAGKDGEALKVDFEDAKAYAHDMIGDINHGMNRFIDWNIMVDRTGGPRHVPGGFAAPLVFEEDGGFYKTISYCYILQIARTAKPGSVRIGNTVYGKEVEAAAVKNPDGTIGVVLLNDGEKELSITIRVNGYLCDVTLPSAALSSLVIEE